MTWYDVKPLTWKGEAMTTRDCVDILVRESDEGVAAIILDWISREREQGAPAERARSIGMHIRKRTAFPERVTVFLRPLADPES